MSNSVRNNQTGNEFSFNQESQVSFEPVIRPPLRFIDKFAKPRIPHLSHRYTVAFMTFFGLFVIFATRCNTQMITIYFSVWRSEDELNWDIAKDLSTLSFWSILISQIPGGILAHKFPANKVFGTGVLCSAVLNFILPWTVDYKMLLSIVCVLQASAQGITFPAVYGILRFWAPPLERSRLATIAISGIFVGMLLGVPMFEFLLNILNWQKMFIFFGILGLVSYAFLYWLVFEKPRDHPTISEEELIFIEHSLEESTKISTLSIPWGKVLTSLPVYSVIIATFCQMWSCYFILYFKPKFLKHRFAFKVHEAGFVSILPYLVLIIFILLGGFLADFLRQRKTATTTNVRKIFTCVSFIVQGLCFFAITRATTASQTLLLFLIITAFSGFAVSGYIINILDIAPRYGSIILGLTNTAGLLPGWICPVVVDWMTSDRVTNDTWNPVLKTSTCLLIGASLVYGIFSSGELQSWADSKRNKNNNTNETLEENSLRNDNNEV